MNKSMIENLYLKLIMLYGVQKRGDSDALDFWNYPYPGVRGYY